MNDKERVADLEAKLSFFESAGFPTPHAILEKIDELEAANTKLLMALKACLPHLCGACSHRAPSTVPGDAHRTVEEHG